jgi:hypothetical protein
MKVFAVALLLAIVGIAIATPEAECDKDYFNSCMDEFREGCGTDPECIKYAEYTCGYYSYCDMYTYY